MKFVGLFIILLLGGLSMLYADNYRDNSKWLKDIPDNTKISDLSILLVMIHLCGTKI